MNFTVRIAAFVVLLLGLAHSGPQENVRTALSDAPYVSNVEHLRSFNPEQRNDARETRPRAVSVRDAEAVSAPTARHVGRTTSAIARRLPGPRRDSISAFVLETVGVPSNTLTLLSSAVMLC